MSEHLRASLKSLAGSGSAAPAVGTDSDPDRVLEDDLSSELSNLFRALADPTRAKMLDALAHSDMTTSGLAALLGINPPAISQHLRTLRMLRVVKPRRDRQHVFYSLDDEHIRLLVTVTVSHLREEQGRARGQQ